MSQNSTTDPRYSYSAETERQFWEEITADPHSGGEETNPTTGPIDTIDAVLRQYLGSMVATEAAINVWRALRRGGHLKECANDDR